MIQLDFGLFLFVFCLFLKYNTTIHIWTTWEWKVFFFVLQHHTNITKHVFNICKNTWFFILSSCHLSFYDFLFHFLFSCVLALRLYLCLILFVIVIWDTIGNVIVFSLCFLCCLFCDVGTINYYLYRIENGTVCIIYSN